MHMDLLNDPMTWIQVATGFTGGCNATGGLELFALVAMLRALWRRRA